MGKHARLSPSGSSRWMACPGSVELCAKLPKRPSSKFADEGTAAHKLAEFCLQHWSNAEKYLGAEIEVNGDKYPVTQEMADFVQLYVDKAREGITKERMDKVLLGVEAKFDLGWLHKDIFGTNDAFAYYPETKILRVSDLKYGQGVIVEPRWNTQMMIYALGALMEVFKHSKPKGVKDIAEVFKHFKPKGVKDISEVFKHFKPKDVKDISEVVYNVELVIVQPRAYHPEGPIRSWTISTKELMFWAFNVLLPAAKETYNENAKLCVGPHCRFCDAIARCPQQIKNACDVAKTTFGPAPVFPDPANMTPDEIAKVLKFSEVVSAWFNSVAGFAHASAEQGQKIPGYKLVQKRSHRKWRDENLALSSLIIPLGDDAFERKVLSVAKAEKALKKVGCQLDENLVYKNDAGTTLVLESDKRPEVSANPMMAFIDEVDIFQ